MTRHPPLGFTSFRSTDSGVPPWRGPAGKVPDYSTFDLDCVLDAVRRTVLHWCGGDCFIQVLEHAAPRRLARSPWAMCEARDVVDSVARVALATAERGPSADAAETMDSLRALLAQRWLTSVPLIAGTLIGTATFVSSTDDLPSVELLNELATMIGRDLEIAAGKKGAALSTAALVPHHVDLRGRLDVIDVVLGRAANENDEPYHAGVRRFVVLARRPSLDGDELLAAALDVTKSEPPRALPAGPCDVTTLVASAIAVDRAPARGRGVDLRVEMPTALPCVACDLEIMLRVLSNIVGNAVTHTPRGGIVIVSAAIRPPFVQLMVSDNGSGITPEAHARIFDPVVRVGRSRYEGGGLSLSLGKAYTEAHGGAITVASTRGRGTAITLSLPITSASPH